MFPLSCFSSVCTFSILIVLTGAHIDETHFLIPACVAWMIKRKATAYVCGLQRKNSLFHGPIRSLF